MRVWTWHLGVVLGFMLESKLVAGLPVGRVASLKRALAFGHRLFVFLCGPLRLCDFYGSNKRILIIFLILPVVVYAREYPTYQLIAHSINDTHLVFAGSNFSVIIGF